MIANDIEDALSPRMAGSTEGMTLQVLAQIRDQLTALNRDVRSTNEATADVRDRVIRLEERDRRMNEIEKMIGTIDSRVDVLLKDKDRRDGAVSFLGKMPSWLSFLIALASVFSALWLFGRSVGVVPAPPIERISREASK